VFQRQDPFGGIACDPIQSAHCELAQHNDGDRGDPIQRPVADGSDTLIYGLCRNAGGGHGRPALDTVSGVTGVIGQSGGMTHWNNARARCSRPTWPTNTPAALTTGKSRSASITRRAMFSSTSV